MTGLADHVALHSGDYVERYRAKPLDRVRALVRRIDYEPQSRIADFGCGNGMKPFTTLAAVIFGLVALLHLYRVIRPFEIVIAGNVIPQWISIVGLIVAGLLAVMLWRERR